MKTFTIVLVGVGCVAVLGNARAQTPGAIQQVDAVQQRQQLDPSSGSGSDDASAPELFPGENTDVGPQSVLKLKPHKTYFEAAADVQYFHTDNLLLDDSDKQSADVLVSTVQFALAPTPYELAGGKFAPRVGYRHQWFDFGLANPDDRVNVYNFNGPGPQSVPLSAFDFNAQTFFTDGRWTRDHWIFEAGFDFTRLMSTSDYNEFYKEYVPRWGAQRIFPLNDAAAFSLGYAGDFRFTDARTFLSGFDHNVDNRTDQKAFAAFSWAVCRYAVVQPYYRFQYTHYTDTDRDDDLHSFGVALNCILCRNCAVRGFVGDDICDSHGRDAGLNYHQLSAGGGVNVIFRF